MENKIGICKVPKESDIRYMLNLYRKAARRPEKYGKLVVDESVRLNAYSLFVAEYELILNGKSKLSANERKEVSNFIDNVISVKNEKPGTNS